MASIETKSMDRPDESRTPDKTSVGVVHLGDATVGRFTLQPGWRWSDCIKPVAGTDSCQAAHLGYVVSGTIHIAANDSISERKSCSPNPGRWLFIVSSLVLLPASSPASSLDGGQNARPCVYGLLRVPVRRLVCSLHIFVVRQVGNGIEPASAQRIAAADALRSEPASAPQAVARDSLVSIMRTGGLEATRRRQQRRQSALVKANRPQCQAACPSSIWWHRCRNRKFRCDLSLRDLIVSLRTRRSRALHVAGQCLLRPARSAAPSFFSTLTRRFLLFPPEKVSAENLNVGVCRCALPRRGATAEPRHRPSPAEMPSRTARMRGR